MTQTPRLFCLASRSRSPLVRCHDAFTAPAATSCPGVAFAPALVAAAMRALYFWFGLSHAVRPFFLPSFAPCCSVKRAAVTLVAFGPTCPRKCPAASYTPILFGGTSPGLRSFLLMSRDLLCFGCANEHARLFSHALTGGYTERSRQATLFCDRFCGVATIRAAPFRSPWIVVANLVRGVGGLRKQRIERGLIAVKSNKTFPACSDVASACGLDQSRINRAVTDETVRAILLALIEPSIKCCFVEKSITVLKHKLADGIRLHDIDQLVDDAFLLLKIRIAMAHDSLRKFAGGQCSRTKSTKSSTRNRRAPVFGLAKQGSVPASAASLRSCAEHDNAAALASRFNAIGNSLLSRVRAMVRSGRLLDGGISIRTSAGHPASTPCAPKFQIEASYLAENHAKPNPPFDWASAILSPRRKPSKNKPRHRCRGQVVESNRADLLQRGRDKQRSC